MFQTIVLIPKRGGRDFRGIDPVEVFWKATMVTINQIISSAIEYHGILHGFQSGRVTETATLEANLPQHITSIRELVLHEVFLVFQKSYSALDRTRCIDILYGYIVGPRTFWLLWTYWDHIQMVSRVGFTMALLSRAAMG